MTWENSQNFTYFRLETKSHFYASKELVLCVSEKVKLQDIEILGWCPTGSVTSCREGVF